MKPEDLLYELHNPQVYTGCEINVVKKEFSAESINICLVFPDTYEIGMSHYGLKLLYHTLNNMENVNAERCFLPDPESIDVFNRYGFSLFSIENRKPLKEFDIIGFSLLSEMNFTNILQILMMAGIPLKAVDRDETFPLIAAGGISVVNPEPLREIIDLFAIGDGEAILPDMVRELEEIKSGSLKKADCLKRFDRIEGVYVPSLYPVEQSKRFFLPSTGGKTIKKRVLQNIDASFSHYRMIVPIGNVVFDRLDVEIARGCPQACRFCQARSYYAPYRSKSLKTNLDFIEQTLERTGFETFSLSTLSPGDYPYLGRLLEQIPGIIDPGVFMSVSSLRPSTLSAPLLSTISLFRRTGITLVPEAGTERLRRVINKDVTDEEIFRAVALALRYKWRKIKLYFMIGLPTETTDDIDGIIKMVEDIVAYLREHKHRVTIHASFSSFVPKPHTPLQWTARDSLENLREKRARIIQGLKRFRNVDLDFHLLERGEVETVLARGDYRVGDLLIDALKQGEIFSAWDDRFHYHVWQQLLEKHRLYDFLLEIPVDQPLPWDIFQVHHHRKYLEKEYRRSLSAVRTPSCRESDCQKCRGCLEGFERIGPFEKENGSNPPLIERSDEVIPYNRVRIYYEKGGDFRFFSHLALMKYMERLVRLTGIRCRHSQGFHRRMKIGAPPPLPVMARGENEVVEIYMDTQLAAGEILRRLQAVSPGLIIKTVKNCSQCPPLSRDLRFMVYEINVTEPLSCRDIIASHTVDSDEIVFLPDKIVLKIDFTQRGPERFAKIYKAIDPEKRQPYLLIRKHVEFGSDL